VLGDAGSIVFDAKLDALLPRFGGNADLAAGGAVFVGVADEIAENLAESLGIGKDGEVFGATTLEVLAFLLGQGEEALAEPGQSGGYRHFLGEKSRVRACKACMSSISWMAA